MTMQLVQCRNFSVRRPFGIELEMDPNVSKTGIRSIISSRCPRQVHITEWQQTADNDYWHVKQDSTCGKMGHIQADYGWEVASYKATTLNDVYHISEVAGALRNGGVTVNENCGFHIHAEVKDFSEPQAAVLLANWIKIEPYIALLVANRRLANKHCKLWSKTKKFDSKKCYEAMEFWEKVKPTNFNPHHNRQKKVSLNFVNFSASVAREKSGHASYRKTVELRLPESTLDPIEICNWIKLFLNFVDNVRDWPMPHDLLPAVNLNHFFYIIGLEHPESFYILGQELLSLKSWIVGKMANSENRFLSSRTSNIHTEVVSKQRLMSESFV